jgi:hypothetical protein
LPLSSDSVVVCSWIPDPDLSLSLSLTHTHTHTHTHTSPSPCCRPQKKCTRTVEVATTTTIAFGYVSLRCDSCWWADIFPFCLFASGGVSKPTNCSYLLLLYFGNCKDLAVLF